MDLNILWVALLAFVGGIIAGLLGWLKSGSNFDPRGFAATLVTALVSGAIFASAYQFTNPGTLTVYDLLAAIIAGVGTDALRSRVSAAIRAGKK
jgi:hypothetical protein